MAWRKATLDLIDETFQGKQEGAEGTWFVEGSEAFFPMIANLDAETASKHLPGVSSIAAHVRHTSYYIEIATRTLKGEAIRGDWVSSWAVQTVSEATWNELRIDLTRQFLNLRQVIEVKEDFTHEQITQVLSNLAHAAFHLGSIRQLLMIHTSAVS